MLRMRGGPDKQSSSWDPSYCCVLTDVQWSIPLMHWMTFAYLRRTRVANPALLQGTRSVFWMWLKKALAMRILTQTPAANQMRGKTRSLLLLAVETLTATSRCLYGLHDLFWCPPQFSVSRRAHPARTICANMSIFILNYPYPRIPCSRGSTVQVI